MSTCPDSGLQLELMQDGLGFQVSPAARKKRRDRVHAADGEGRRSRNSASGPSQQSRESAVGQILMSLKAFERSCWSRSFWLLGKVTHESRDVFSADSHGYHCSLISGLRWTI